MPIFRGKNFVSAVSSFKDSARVAMRTNLPIASTVSIIDGVNLIDKDRVLLAGQSNPVQNGIYTWSSASQKLTRSFDADSIFELNPGTKVYVAEGNANGKSTWAMITPGVINPGVTSIIWAKENQIEADNSPGTYGSAGKTLQIVLDETGQVDSITEFELNADNIAEGSNNLFFTADRTVDGGEF
jgi:phage-related tail fiber protein